MKRVEYIHYVAGRVVTFFGWVILFLCVAFVVKEILFKTISALAEYELMPWVIVTYKYVFFGSFGICMCCLIIKSICEHLGVKSDEEIEEENRIRYVIEQYENSKKGDIMPDSLPENYDPLRNLDKQQRQIALELLARLPVNPKKTNEIKLDMLAHYLTAFYELSYLDIVDKVNLRLWAAKITGKDIPDSSHFNAAVPKKDSKKLDEAKAVIVKALRPS